MDFVWLGLVLSDFVGDRGIVGSGPVGSRVVECSYYQAGRPRLNNPRFGVSKSCAVTAKFHYTGPTGPDRTRPDPTGRDPTRRDPTRRSRRNLSRRPARTQRTLPETRISDPGLRQSPLAPLIASSQHTLFIFGHTRSSIHIIFFSNNRSFLPVCFPSSLESTTGPPPSTPH